MSLDCSHRSENLQGRKRAKDFNNSNSSSHQKPKKKKDHHKKMLGMAWGTNSPSSSKSSSRKVPLADFSSYMAEKNRKLRNQFDADASNSSNSGDSLFHGVSIFVDGFTIPSSQELRGYMLKYGGRFENYFSRHRVTHIICSNLPDSKLRNLRSFSGGLPVVKPDWVMDSIAANRVLNWSPYQPDKLVNENRCQQKLSSFFSLRRNLKSEHAKTPVHFHEKLDTERLLSVADASKDTMLLEVDDISLLKSESHCGEESGCVGHESARKMRIGEPSVAAVEVEDVVREALQHSPDRQSATVSSSRVDNRDDNEPLISRIQGSHSNIGHADFVENYFKSSRLHFIGTWRGRYRKRFSHLSHGVKCRNANDNAVTERTVIHIDMDCFFVSVILRSYPDLIDKPVGVCHSNNPKGTAEISSANYPARDYGIRAGMFVRDAKALCPHLVIFPYNFKAYEEVADQFYDILHKYCSKVQAISCDEAFLDVTDLEDDNPENLASTIRQEIFKTTRCTASAGIAGSLLMARLATTNAKPNGQFFIPFEKVYDYLNNLLIKFLPGIGYVLSEKLKNQNIQTCGQLREISKESLQKDFGTKTGDMLWNYSRGIDHRAVEVVQATKSIGAEINWGVRFYDPKDTRDFLVKLCKEVSLRLQGCAMQGRTITLKVKKRRKGAEMPQKYMGCGDCENLSHSITVPTATDDVDVLKRITKQLFGSFCIDVKEVRGIGLQVSRLENSDMGKKGHEKNALRTWLLSASENTREACQAVCPAKGSVGGASILHVDQSSADATLNQDSTLPPICHLDMGVIESLPSEIISEINEMYNGRLMQIMAESKDNVSGASTSGRAISPHETEGQGNKGKEPLCSSPIHMDAVPTESKVMKTAAIGIPKVSISCSRSVDLHTTAATRHLVHLMPASLSQIDISVLQELPEALKADVIKLLPPHRTSEHTDEAMLVCAREYSHDSVRRDNDRCFKGGSDFVPSCNLWMGNPPRWVEKFTDSNWAALNILGQFYYKSGSDGLLSSILQCVAPTFAFSLGLHTEDWDDALSSLCELLKQYIELKIESDIEELYICFRLLKRFRMKSEFLRQAYDIVFPTLQACFRENYGGNLQLSHAE